MNAVADLEIELKRRDAARLQAELRYNHPESDADVRLLPAGAELPGFDPEALAHTLSDPIAYGRALGEGLFGSEALRTGFEKASAAAQSLDAALRVRLSIASNTSELHALRWETLIVPGTDTPLAMREQLLFSRYVASSDLRPVKPVRRDDVSALVAIANPEGVERYSPGESRLTPVDVEGELARARTGMATIPITALASRGEATLAGIVSALHDGHDILYLVCHGAFIEGESRLWLENAQGEVAVESGQHLVDRLADLERRPRLVILASCQSSGTGNTMDDGALAGLGPRLAEAGVPAVLSMQGNISMETVEAFMPVLFAELARDGQIDRAVAAARYAVRDRPDWWMPVLSMRLRSGRLLYSPGFAGEQSSLDKWPALVRNLKSGRCTPVLGPGLSESLLGPEQEIARRWAESHGYPMYHYQRESMAHVAQYLAVNQDYNFPRAELRDAWRTQILERYGSIAGEVTPQTPLRELMLKAWEIQGAEGRCRPHKVLAELRLPIYITTEMHDLLEQALRRTNVAEDDASSIEPRTEICRWSPDLEILPSVYDDEPDYRPTTQRPLVYHLFGHESEPESMVLTQDDYSDFLVGLTANKELIPSAVRRAVADSALLFLGFRLHEDPFRVLFRTMMSQEGRRRRYAHVAAQLEPDERDLAFPERALGYIERYFGADDISLFWGSGEDFVTELEKEMSR